MDADVFKYEEKSLRFKKYPDTCGRGLYLGVKTCEAHEWRKTKTTKGSKEPRKANNRSQNKENLVRFLRRGKLAGQGWTLNDRQSDISLKNSEKLRNLTDLNYDIFNKRLHLQT